ncbi:MAG: hypothetical protein LBE09_01315 [Christensenellaceae bacterium]|nr:hypothetical protein [Christensenellaceae bacterium]
MHASRGGALFGWHESIDKIRARVVRSMPQLGVVVVVPHDGHVCAVCESFASNNSKAGSKELLNMVTSVKKYLYITI